MTSRTEKNKTTPWDFDLRVRDRNLANGTIEPKAVEKYLADLPDLESQCETMEMQQPALGVQD